MWVLGNKFGSSARTVHTYKPQAISQAPWGFFLKPFFFKIFLNSSLSPLFFWNSYSINVLSGLLSQRSLRASVGPLSLYKRAISGSLYNEWFFFIAFGEIFIIMSGGTRPVEVFSFIQQTQYLGLACSIWLTFVGFCYSDNLVFIVPACCYDPHSVPAWRCHRGARQIPGLPVSGGWPSGDVRIEIAKSDRRVKMQELYVPSPGYTQQIFLLSSALPRLSQQFASCGCYSDRITCPIMNKIGSGASHRCLCLPAHPFIF